MVDLRVEILDICAVCGLYFRRGVTQMKVEINTFGSKNEFLRNQKHLAKLQLGLV